jgi:hypothetical protein
MSNHQRNLCEACLKSEYEEFRHSCVHEFMTQNEAWINQYNINLWPRWDYEMDDATLVFSENGRAKVIANMLVVGTGHGKEWEWSWGNANIPDRHRASLKDVHDFGAEKGWSPLTTLFLNGGEYSGWELSAVAGHVLQAQALYRCPNGAEDFVYLAILQTQFVQ